MPITLSINSGSSSVKVSIYNSAAKDRPPTQLADASISGLTALPAQLTYERDSERIKNQEVQRGCLRIHTEGSTVAEKDTGKV